jgi:8-oxo-dGTP diphosphatase
MSIRIGKDCIGIGVGALIPDGKGRFLLSKRGPECPYDVGYWEFPGGKVDFGETLETAVIREVEEETGLRVWVDAHLGFTQKIDPNERHWIGHTFLCPIARPFDQEPKIIEPGKCVSLTWFTIAEIDRLHAELSLNKWAQTDWLNYRDQLIREEVRI